MSKTTKTSAQNYVNPTGSISVSGGPNVTYKNGNTNYVLNSAQQETFDYAQNAFKDGLQSINVFSPETQKQLTNQVNAYKQNALSELESLYSPMLKSVREDSAKRFGNIDNSEFLNNLNSVEKNRAHALAKLEQNISAMQNELINEELKNRYNYLNFINSYQNQVLNNALNFSNLANSNANLNGQYQAQNVKTNANNFDNMLAMAALVSKFLV